MMDINEAPDKRAATLEKFLENCEHEDPYIQNIWMAARHLVTAGLGHCEYQTQYGKRHHPLDRCRLPSLDSSNTLSAKETQDGDHNTSRTSCFSGERCSDRYLNFEGR